jgi:hypothetical protein
MNRSIAIAEGLGGEEREASLTVGPYVELLGLAAPSVEEVEDVLHGAVPFPPLLLLRPVPACCRPPRRLLVLRVRPGRRQ